MAAVNKHRSVHDRHVVHDVAAKEGNPAPPPQGEGKGKGTQVSNARHLSIVDTPDKAKKSWTHSVPKAEAPKSVVEPESIFTKALDKATKAYQKAKHRWMTYTAAFSATTAGAGYCLGIAALADISHNAVGSLLFRNPLLIPEAWLIGVLPAILIAADHAWNEWSGKVDITLDDEKRTARFFTDPLKFKQTAQEAAVLSGDGLVRRLPNVPRRKTKAIFNKPAKHDVSPATQDLLKKFGSRRLVADLGVKTIDNQPALSLVDPLAAAQLLSIGKKVYVVSGQATTSKDRDLAISAHTGDRHQDHRSVVQWKEVTFDYHLTRLTADGSVGDIPEGTEVPDSMEGVLRPPPRKKDGSFTEVTVHRNDFATDEIVDDGGKPTNKRTESMTSVTRGNLTREFAAPRGLHPKASKPSRLRWVPLGVASLMVPNILAAGVPLLLIPLVLYGAKKAGDLFLR